MKINGEWIFFFFLAYPGPASGGIFSPANGPGGGKKRGNDGKDLHMFVWSSSASPVSEGGIHVFRGGVGAGEYGNGDIGAGLPHHNPKGLVLTFVCYNLLLLLVYG